jgi:hypothetical protein
MNIRQITAASIIALVGMSAGAAQAKVYDFTVTGVGPDAGYVSGTVDLTANVVGGVGLVTNATGAITISDPVPADSIYNGHYTITGVAADNYAAADQLLYVPQQSVGGNPANYVDFGGVSVTTNGGTLGGPALAEEFNFGLGGHWGSQSIINLSNPNTVGYPLGEPYSYQISISAVPEPAIWAMLLLGFFGVGFMVRGSRRQDAVAAA